MFVLSSITTVWVFPIRYRSACNTLEKVASSFVRNQHLALSQVLDFGVKQLEDVSIMIAHNPVDTSPRATVQYLDDPSLVFFDPTKCHISSNSISRTSLGTSGLPKEPNEALPSAYKITASVCRAVRFGTVRRSPARGLSHSVCTGAAELRVSMRSLGNATGKATNRMLCTSCFPLSCLWRSYLF